MIVNRLKTLKKNSTIAAVIKFNHFEWQKSKRPNWNYTWVFKLYKQSHQHCTYTFLQFPTILLLRILLWRNHVTHCWHRLIFLHFLLKNSIEILFSSLKSHKVMRAPSYSQLAPIPRCSPVFVSGDLKSTFHNNTMFLSWIVSNCVFIYQIPMIYQIQLITHWKIFGEIVIHC